MDRSRVRKATLSLVAALCAGLAGAAEHPLPRRPVPTTRQAPDEFGTQDYGVTVVWAGSFAPERNTSGYPPYLIGVTNFGLSFVNPIGGCLQSGHLADAYATANIPSGAIIDFIGLETETVTFAEWGVDLVLLGRYNGQTLIGSVNSTVHGWDSDYNETALGFQLEKNVHNALVVHIQKAGFDQDCGYFGWVEIWWRRPVSPAPENPTFADVPTSDFGYQYIEALFASGITGGCGGTNYCPDAPLTRRQMAIFLAKALGLHWPY